MEKRHVMKVPLAVALSPENKLWGSEEVRLEKQAGLEVGFVPLRSWESRFRMNLGANRVNLSSGQILGQQQEVRLQVLDLEM